MRDLAPEEESAEVPRPIPISYRSGLSDSEQARVVRYLRSGASWAESVRAIEAEGGAVNPKVWAGWRSALEARAAEAEGPRMPAPPPPKPKDPPVMSMTRQQLMDEVLRLRAERDRAATPKRKG